MNVLRIKVGSEFFGKGQTTVEISSNGNIVAKNLLNKKQYDCKVTIRPEEVNIIHELLSNIKIRKPQRKPVPDEVIYNFEIISENITSTIMILHNDLRNYPELHKMISNISNLLYKHSETKIIL
jgi:type IV secretory pathway ATPase VirB11/archaellum biosynthesis ATPase